MLVTANVLQPLIDVFESILKFFHNSGGISWGWSIVLLTIAVRAVLVPLTFRQIKSMVRMQGLQPQMKEIQAKYKQDKQRQQEEMMKFYRENNVNPLGSCLPLVLQLPVFVSLYYMLRKSLREDICPGIQAKYQQSYAHAHHLASAAAAHGQTTACGTHAAGAHFLFINDLTAKATGIELGILIVLYIGSQLGSTLVMSATSMDPTQRRIMMFMPLIFVLFVIRFPAGLLLYWITTNLWTVAQQYTVKRYIGPTRAAVPAVAGDAGGGTAAAVAAGGGSGGGGSGGGGIGARMRDRLFAVQEQAVAAQRERAASGSGGSRSAGRGSASTTSGGNGNGNGGGSNGASASGGNGSSGAKASNGGSSGSDGASTGAGRGSVRRRRGAGSGGSNGGGSGETPTSGTSGNGARAGTPPPRPPRKKKKRSGRRR